jgi:CRP/FNR family transcriptional regulator, cyclic AMP receptor protein
MAVRICPMPDLTILQTIPLFRELPDAELEALGMLLIEREFSKGSDIVRVDEPGDTFYVIQEGEVEMSLRDAEGRYVPLDRIDAGDFFGELAMLTGEARSATATAVTPVRVWELDRDTFYRFLTAYPTSAIRVLTVLARRLRDTEHLLEVQVSENPNRQNDDQVTPVQRIADAIADFSGSLLFLALNAGIFAAWIVVNLPGSPIAFDPFPFGFLTMSVSLEAIFLSIFVLISQNRQAAKDRIKSEGDYRVNLKAELEIGLVLKNLRDIQDRIEVMQRDQARFHSLVAHHGHGSAPLVAPALAPDEGTPQMEAADRG